MLRTVKMFLPVFFVSLCLIMFELILESTKVPKFIIPLPSEVVNVILTDWESILHNTFITITEWIIGIFLSILFGLILSFLSFKSNLVHSILNPLLIISQSTPYLVFTPLLMIWFGLGMTPKIVLVILTCSFPITIVMQNDLRHAKNEYHLIVKMLHLKPIKAFVHVYFPYALPGFFNALKISVSYSFASAVLAELMGSEKGLGVYLLRAQSTYRTDKVIACVLVIVTISILSTSLVTLLQKNIIFWKTEKR